MLYHCITLARLYGDKCAEHVKQWPGLMVKGKDPPWAKDDKVVTVLEELFFEFESLVTSIVRSYEYIRYPMWQKYGSAKNTPRNFESTINKCSFPDIILGKGNLSSAILVSS